MLFHPDFTVIKTPFVDKTAMSPCCVASKFEQTLDELDTY